MNNYNGLLYIFDREEKLLSILNNEASESDIFFDDEFKKELNGEWSYKFSVDMSKTKDLMLEYNKVGFYDRAGNFQLFVIHDIEDNIGYEAIRTVYCLHDFQSLNENIIEEGKIVGDAKTALNLALKDSNYVVGIVSNTEKQVKNLSMITVLEAIHSIAETYNLEIYYRLELDKTKTKIVKRYVDLVERLGSDTGLTFNFSLNIESIKRKINNNFFTVLYGRGKQLKDETYATFADTEWKKGDNPCDKPKGQIWVSDEEAIKKYGERKGIYSNEKISISDTLLRRTWEKLQKVNRPKINYEASVYDLSSITGYENLKINLGDRFNILDDIYNINEDVRVIVEYESILDETSKRVELGDPVACLTDDGIGGSYEDIEEDEDIGEGGEDGEGGSGEDVEGENTLPQVPVVTAEGYFATVSITWTFENKSYYTYELYASDVKGFSPTEDDKIFEGKASAFLHEVNPSETWYYKVRVKNGYGRYTEFSKEVSAETLKITDGTKYFESMAIKDALIGELNLDRGWVGELKGNYIDAKQLSVTDGNGKRTLDIDSFGNVNLDVASLKISSSNVATESYAKTQASNAQSNAISSANASTDNKLKNYYTTTQTDTKIKVLNDSISLKASKTEVTEQIDNLELGTRNYIVGSDFSKDNSLNNWASWYHTTLALATYNYGSGLDIDSFIVGKKEFRARTDIAQCIASGYAYGGFRNVNITVEKNTTYTLSTWVFVGANVKEFQIRAYMVSDDGNTLLTRLGTFSDTLGKTGAFRKVTYTFTTTNESSLISLRFYNYFKDTVTTGNADLHLYQPMLSKGDKPKDWVVAQEDVKEDINILSEKISSAELKIEPNAIISTVTSSESWENQTNNISGLENRVSSAEQKITDKAIVNTVTSSETWKNQTNDISGLTDRVSKAEQKITDEAITSTVSKGFVSQSSFNSLELGNRNYLLYTNFDKNDATTKWSKWGGCSLDIPIYTGGQLKDIDAHINGKKVLRSRTKIETQITNNAQYGGFAPPYVTLEKNTTYTFSCWLYQTSTVKEMQVRAYYVNRETNLLGSEIKRVTIPGTWVGSFQKVTLTFTVGAQSDLVSIRFYNYHDATLTTGNSDMMLYQPMLTKGDKAKDWVEATEEVSLGIVEAQSQITQLADEISLKVSKGDVNSIIRQSPSDIQIGFNGINDRIEINSQYMKFEAENGNRDMLLYGGQTCIYNNTDNTFMSTLGNVLREDTSYRGVGFLAGKNCNAFFIGRDSSWSDILTNRSPNPQGVFFINFANNVDGNKGVHIRDTLYITNNIQAIHNSQPTITGFKDIACTNSIFDNWKSVVDQSTIMRYDGSHNVYLGKNLNGNGFTANNFSTITATQYSVSNSSNIRIARGELYDPKNGSVNRDYVRLAKTYMFGGTGVMYFTNADTADWANIYAGTIYSKQTAITSDMNLKTDIKYVNIDPQTISEDSGLMAPNINITTSDMHEFIETLPMVSYRMKDDVKNGIDDTYYGFLAQEILYTKVGSELVKIEEITDSNGETKESYRYSENKLVSFIAGALQEEIKQRKKLEIELEKLKNEIENLKNK